MLTKSALAHAVAKDNGLTISKATQVISSILSTLESSLADGENVRLTGFGSFRVKETKARTGRNPSTGEPIQVSESRRVSFSAGSNLTAAVRGK
jgi:DNA-binding protein HU-beta